MITIFWYILIGTLVIHLSYYVFLFSRLTFYRNTQEKLTSYVPLSLIVCYKNDKENVERNLPYWLEQQYPEFEIILVDDFSDSDQQVLVDDSKVRIIKASKDIPGKKQALIDGIKYSRFETILLTDADCKPLSKHWMRAMVDSLGSKQIVLGFGGYYDKKGWVNHFARFETFITAVQYMSYALAGLPYMGVGRNLLYKKECLPLDWDVLLHDGLISGDDDMMIQRIANSKNVSICFNDMGFTYSDAVGTWSSLERQKVRHHSTSVKYQPVHKLLLGIYAVTHILFWTLSVLMLIFGVSFFLIFVIIIVKWLVQFLILYKPALKLKSEDLMKYFPLLDITYFVYMVIFAPLLLFKKNHIWK